MFIPVLYENATQKITEDETLKKLRIEAIERYGLETRRYARKQKKWLKNRISKPDLKLPIYRMDTSNKEKWKENVLIPATHIVISLSLPLFS